MTNSNGSNLLAGTAVSDIINSINENIGAGPPVRAPTASFLGDVPQGARNEEEQMSDHSQVEFSELTNRRIAYAAKVAELQYKQAKRICDEINGIPIGIDDPMVLAVLKAISINYVALGRAAELRLCSNPEAAEFDAQPPRFTARSRPGQIR